LLPGRRINKTAQCNDAQQDQVTKLCSDDLEHVPKVSFEQEQTAISAGSRPTLRAATRRQPSTRAKWASRPFMPAHLSSR
jgi:hypothetical protein